MEFHTYGLMWLNPRCGPNEQPTWIRDADGQIDTVKAHSREHAERIGERRYKSTGVFIFAKRIVSISDPAIQSQVEQRRPADA